MAKRREEVDETRRRSRKEVLLERRHQRQTRQARIAIGIVVGLLVLVLLLGLIIEGVVRPRQAVAEVNGDTIALNDWQDRVRFQRAQFIIGLEDQLAAFQDIGLVQQFSQQQIALLQDPQTLGEQVLQLMIDEEIVRQEAVARGISVSDDDLDERLAEQFGYYGGVSPTPTATATATIQPTPSLTPIPTAVITEVVPTTTPFPTPTLGPTSTPAPSPTPLSEEAYQEELSSYFQRFRDLGVDEDSIRAALRGQILREKLAESLAEAENLPEEAEQASAYVLSFEEEADAEEALTSIEENGFLEVWNRLRSTPADAENAPPGTASEVLWRTQEQYTQQFGPAVAEAVFALELSTPSAVLAQEASADGTQPARYYVVQVSGREVRPLSQATIEANKMALVTDLISAVRDSGQPEIVINPVWRTRVPTTPILDPQFLVQPTPQPAIPTSAATPAPGQ